MKSLKRNDSFKQLEQIELEEISGGSTWYDIYLTIVSSVPYVTKTSPYGCGSLGAPTPAPTPQYYPYPANQSNIYRP